MFEEIEAPTIKIEASDINSYNYYEVTRLSDIASSYGKDAVLLLATSLLEIAEYVEKHRALLETQAKTDYERNHRAIEAEYKDMAQIDREWRKFRMEE